MAVEALQQRGHLLEPEHHGPHPVLQPRFLRRQQLHDGVGVTDPTAERDVSRVALDHEIAAAVRAHQPGEGFLSVDRQGVR